MKDTANPGVEFHGDDGTVLHGAEAVAARNAYWKEREEHNRRVLAQMKTHELARFEAWLRTRTRDQPPAPPTPVRPANGRAPREARNDRRRGSRRGERSSSSSSDDPDPDPEPAERRLCENKRCRADISHLRPDARYCANGGACKQAAWRDRQTIKKLDDLEGTVSVDVSCDCKPKRGPVIDGVCLPCGRPRGAVTLQWERDPAPQARSFVAAHALKRRNARLGDGKREPLTVLRGAA